MTLQSPTKGNPFVVACHRVRHQDRMVTYVAPRDLDSRGAPGIRMTTPPVTVFVVDDDATVREGVGHLIRSVGLRPQLFVAAQDFLESPQPDAPACLILDISVPGLGGVDCWRQLADAGIHIPIIFTTSRGDIRLSVRAMKAGAIDYLTKPLRDRDLLDAIQQAIARDRARRAQEAGNASLSECLGALTRREREVMAWVVAGQLNKQIAAEIGVSEITIKVHRGRVMRKMRAESVADLVRIAGRLGLALLP